MKTNKKRKRGISLILVLTIIFTLSGCGGSGASGTSETKPGTVIEENADSITIVDQANREVTVPKDVKSTAFCYRVIARFILSLDKGDTIKGMGKKEPFLELVQPTLAEASDVGKGVVDIEALANLFPDLFFHKSNDTETLEAVEKLGIPAVGVTVETPEDMVVAIDIMGKVLGAEDKAQELVDYYNEKLKKDEELIAGVKEKKTAVVMGSTIGNVADSSMLQGFMIEKAGGINVAASLDATETWPMVGVEQIFAWDPEYIFISGSESSNYTVDDIMKDKTWAEVTAVKKGQVYEMPASQDSWEFPGIVSVLGIDYMMSKMYPELISNEELDKNIDEFYQISYGRTFTEEELGY